MTNNLTEPHWTGESTPQIRLLKWILFKVVAPLVVIFIIWPIFGFSLDIHNSFEKAFAHGDLFVFSALILIEAAIEGEQSHIGDWRFHLGRFISIILALVSIIGFVVVKMDVMRDELNPDFYKLFIYGTIGWFMAILAGILSIYYYWRASYKQALLKLSSFEQPNP